MSPSAMPIAPTSALAPPPPGTGALDASAETKSLQEWSVIMFFVLLFCIFISCVV